MKSQLEKGLWHVKCMNCSKPMKYKIGDITKPICNECKSSQKIKKRSQKED